MHGQNVLGRGRLGLRLRLAGQLHVHLVARGIRRHAGMIERLRRRRQALRDRLAPIAGSGQGGDEIGDVGRGELVNGARSEDR